MKPDILDYKSGIHPDCGKFYFLHKDIIITPFYTEEYCQRLVNFCKENASSFINTGSSWDDPYSNYSLFFERINQKLFEEYVAHFMDKINPIVKEVFIWDRNIESFFSPFINRFGMQTQTDMALHCEDSRISTVVKLNDEFTGGALNFPRQKYRNMDLPVGYALVFPGMVTHPHFVETLTSGERYTLVGFTCPPEWRGNNIIKVNH
jgi:hypothetical protein